MNPVLRTTVYPHLEDDTKHTTELTLFNLVTTGGQKETQARDTGGSGHDNPDYYEVKCVLTFWFLSTYLIM